MILKSPAKDHHRERLSEALVGLPEKRLEGKQRAKLSGLFDEVSATRYMAPNQTPSTMWKVVYPRRATYSLSSAFAESLLELGESSQVEYLASSVQFGANTRTAQFLDSWNRVNRVGEARQRESELESIGTVFYNMSLSSTPELPQDVSENIAWQHALIAHSISVEDITVGDAKMPHGRILG